MSHTVIARAPVRIDFGGGWTDVPPYSDEMGGFVCNLAITRYATAIVNEGAAARRASTTDATASRAADDRIVDAARRRLGVRDVRVVVRSDFPVGAGLGGSSAAGVATLAALANYAGRDLAGVTLAELSREIEIEDLGIAGGRQDHYAAVFGGALGLRLDAAGVHVQRIPLTPALRSAIEHRCLVIYTGQSRISGGTIIAVLDAYRARTARVVNALARSRELAQQMAVVLGAGDLDGLAGLVAEQWVHQRSLHPDIPTPRIDAIIEKASAAGALGAKALGASGGGCVLVIAAADRVDSVREAITPLGELLSFGVDEHGVTLCP